MLISLIPPANPTLVAPDFSHSTVRRYLGIGRHAVSSKTWGMCLIMLLLMMMIMMMMMMLLLLLLVFVGEGIAHGRITPGLCRRLTQTPPPVL